MNCLIFVFLALVGSVLAQKLRLYPKESETREVKLLNGIWNFRVIPLEDDQNIGFTKKWYSQPLEEVILKSHLIKVQLKCLCQDWRSDPDARSLQLQ